MFKQNTQKQQQKTFYLSTPIFYPNAQLHLGHVYTMILADIIIRYKESVGYDTYLQTGSDEHGEKIIKETIKRLNDPKDLDIEVQKTIQKNVESFYKLFDKLNLKKYFFFRTSSVEHIDKTLYYFQQLQKKREIYFGKFFGDYCVSCEDFQKKEINECESCQQPTKKIQEECWFLKVAEKQSWLKELFKREDLIIPKKIKEELINNFLNKDLKDLCVTRQKNVGIPLNAEKTLTIYVWFDALLNYLTSEKGRIFFEKKKEDNTIEIVHLIGKDISRFHCIYWPIMLKALDFPLPDKILVHGWLLQKEKKISKSNLTEESLKLDPLYLLEEKKVPISLLRAYLSGKITTFCDGAITTELLSKFYKDFFLNNLGNLLNRSIKMLMMYYQGKISFSTIIKEKKISNIFSLFTDLEKDELLSKYYAQNKEWLIEFKEALETYKISKAFNFSEQLVKASNQFINNFSPWKKIEKEHQLTTSFFICLLGGIRLLSFFFSFFLPETSQEIIELFGFSKPNWDNCLDLKEIINKNKIIKNSFCFPFLNL